MHDAQDAALLSMWVTLLYVCLEVPNDVYHHTSLNNFFPRAALRFLVVLAIVVTLINFPRL